MKTETKIKRDGKINRLLCNTCEQDGHASKNCLKTQIPFGGNKDISKNIGCTVYGQYDHTDFDCNYSSNKNQTVERFGFDTKKRFWGEGFPSTNENNTKEHERENWNNEFVGDQQNIDQLLSENINKHIIQEHEKSISTEDPLFIENDLNIGQDIQIQNDESNTNEIETTNKN
ncbi:unnamed protein product [Mytilus coruscus]|uniref:CCHC-type domain-containing protein n=1 Tax=Mytilus coruscus TaxID=42192 RepID=A0A6J8BEJ0_MYTCO|nr:unnamed protein product [Mytilus coruscus]